MATKNTIKSQPLEFYGYGEQNNMQSNAGYSYSVKVSGKKKNIISIEKDGSLYATVGIDFDKNKGVMKLVDITHNNSTLAEVSMPNADYIYNCRYNKASGKILFDVKSLYGNKTSTIEIDVNDLVEVYEAGQGIKIGAKDARTGKRKISIKIAAGENILQLSDDGLKLSDSITTDDELAAAVSGKADISYVDEAISSISGVSGVTELREKVAAISELKGVSGSDISNYDDSGSGILDELHREFHAMTDDYVHKATGAQITNDGEIAIGKYNVSNTETDPVTGEPVPSGCTAFSIGAGTSNDDRKNLLEVREDGTLWLWIENEYMPVNDLLAMLAHEVYDD